MYNGPQRKIQRLKNYDYSSNGFYFVTICTKNRENYFGEITDGKMILNDYGKIAEQNWKGILKHYQNIEIDEFVIMPNHIHGIIIIVGNEYFRSDKGNADENNGNEYFRSDKGNADENNGNEYFRLDKGNADENNENQNNRNENIHSLQKINLSNVIKGFKIGCTKEIRNIYNNFIFSWQKSFFDAIIRTDEQLEKTRQYIIDNPLKWEFDKNNSVNIKK